MSDLDKFKNKWVKLSIAAFLLLLAWGWLAYPPFEDKFDHGPLSLLNKRPAHFNPARIDDWELLLNGKPVADNQHTVRIGETLLFTGHLYPVMKTIPPGAVSGLVVSLRPVDHTTTEETWDIGDQERGWEWPCYAITEKRIIDDDHIVNSRNFVPGDYNARIYFIVEDSDAGENTVDLISTAKFTILAQEP
ncbi:hypothetical protein [Rubinisphaera sp.]|uniref:hypothetical protein n=1 Tax=Rubinisphaera sp. TaxID=2024857 RepID=UPI000C0FFEA0|nr:hypothetical protein [Rubinisphaera sp.]MBV10300.1 hypothetical protein [Rubinisphaera sp.]HCS50481.1 hypothetical protein [Planctomycetaceae bacterium]|tara:strand:- start:6265 stop:6837 length:573 start_codon:yes stop_codon:yes gene_type:complete